MGKLKKIIFMAEISKETRLDAGTLRSINFPDNSLTNTRQIPDKNLITNPDKKSTPLHGGYSLETISTARQNNCVTSKQASTNTSSPQTHIDGSMLVESQSNEEWLDEYYKYWTQENEDLFRH